MLDRYAAREAIYAHRLALLDPVEGEGAIMAWCAMQRTRETPATYEGPQIFFDPAGYRAPVLPAGGLPAAEALELYLAGSPLPLNAVGRSDRISVRHFREPPSPLRCRSIAAPPLNYPRHREHFEKWQRFEMRLRAVPSPHHLASWLRRQRTAHWYRFAVHRFLADAAAGAILAYDRGGYDVPPTFWESDTDLDADRGNLFCRSDSRMPLRRALRFHMAADVPEIVRDRAARALGAVKAGILAALADYAAEFDEGMPISERIAILADVLPYSRETIRTVVYREAAARRALAVNPAETRSTP